MGASGSGKTTLAKTLARHQPEKYRWITQVTTREPRHNEVEGREYNFIGDVNYESLSEKGALIAQVRKEFRPHRYGTPIAYLEEDKVNIIVASIEGFLDALTKFSDEDEVNVLFIRNVEPEVTREKRDFTFEDKYNQIVLEKVQQLTGNFNICSVMHSILKTIRNDKEKLLKFMEVNEL